SAEEGQGGWGLAQEQPAQQDGDRRHEIRRRGELAGRRPRERKRPSREGDRSRERSEVEDPADRACVRSSEFPSELGRERQAGERCDEAAEKRGLQGGKPTEYELLQDDAACVG